MRHGLTGVILISAIVVTSMARGDVPWVTKSLATQYREQEAIGTVPDKNLYVPADRANDVDEIATRLIAWKTKLDGNLWYECGVRYRTDEKKMEAATAWATVLYDEQSSAVYKLRSGEQVQIPLEQVLGIITNESRFDRCALGPSPRAWAAENNIVQRKPGMSYTEEELTKIFTDKRWKGDRHADLGPGQILWSKRKGDYHQYVELKPGLRHVFQELVQRGIDHDTKEPAAYWPGQRSADYLNKILRFGRAFFKTLQA